MVAFKLDMGRHAYQTQEEDPRTLACKEASMAHAEAALAARLADIQCREEQSARALEDGKRELVVLAHSRAGALATDALGRIPAFAPLPQTPLPERLKANDARCAAIRARDSAIQLEERAITRREEALAAVHLTLAGLQKAVATIRAKDSELARAERAPAERAKATPLPHEDVGLLEEPPPQPISRPVCAHPRQHRRVTLETEVTLSSESNFYTGFSKDLSDGGIFVATCNLLATGTPVDLRFVLPGGMPIVAIGAVRWSREFNEATPDVYPGMGVEFTEMSSEHRHAVHSFTIQREPLFWAG